MFTMVANHTFDEFNKKYQPVATIAKFSVTFVPTNFWSHNIPGQHIKQNKKQKQKQKQNKKPLIF